MVVVGRDAGRAIAELGRLAPPERSGALARTRAAELRIAPSGAAAAIVAALEAGIEGSSVRP
jgi:hypothetical protein